MTVTQISPHVYWMPPGPPDRPSLCAVVGSEHTLLLDAGSSPAHIRHFLDDLGAKNPHPPRYVALTHWHWDHVFGAAELGIPVIAHTLIADRLATMAAYDWSDAALDDRIKTGEESVMFGRDIKIELPEPRQVTIAVPDLVFQTSLDVSLGGGVTCHIQHVGGDHSPDSTVMFVEPDRVLFLGDCLYTASSYEPAPYYTRTRAYRLLDTLLSFDPQVIVGGHDPEVMNRAEFKTLADTMRRIGTLAEQLDEDAMIRAVQTETGQEPDDLMREIIHGFVIGRAFEA